MVVVGAIEWGVCRGQKIVYEERDSGASRQASDNGACQGSCKVEPVYLFIRSARHRRSALLGKDATHVPDSSHLYVITWAPMV